MVVAAALVTLWRTGRGEPRCIYRGDELIGMALDIEQAAEIVRAMNDRARDQARILDPREIHP